MAQNPPARGGNPFEITDWKFYTPEQQESLIMLSWGAHVTRVEAWQEKRGLIGVQVTEDGAVRTGFVSPNGCLDGDWL